MNAYCSLPPPKKNKKIVLWWRAYTRTSITYNRLKAYLSAQTSSLRAFVIGASAASTTLTVKWENCLYIYISCVFRIYTSCPICARCNISTLHVDYARLAGQNWERLNSGNQRNWDLKTVRKGGTTSKTRRLINVLRDTAANGLFHLMSIPPHRWTVCDKSLQNMLTPWTIEFF